MFRPKILHLSSPKTCLLPVIVLFTQISFAANLSSLNHQPPICSRRGSFLMSFVRTTHFSTHACARVGFEIDEYSLASPSGPSLCSYQMKLISGYGNDFQVCGAVCVSSSTQTIPDWQHCMVTPTLCPPAALMKSPPAPWLLRVGCER